MAKARKPKAKRSIEEVCAEIKAHPEAKTFRGATDVDIRDALRIMQVKWPKSYVVFLKTCGYAELAGDVIFGLGPDVDKNTSVFEVSLRESLDANPQLRGSLTPLWNDGTGSHECLDTETVKDGDCRVVLWDHEHPKGFMQRPKKICDTFTEWLANKVDAMPGIE